MKMETDWEEDERKIMAHFFNKYPVLKTVYGLSQKLRLWYNGRNIGKHTDIIEQELYNW